MDRNPDDIGGQSADRENTGSTGSTGGYGNSGGTTGSAGYGAGGYGADATTSIGEAGLAASGSAGSVGATPSGMGAGSAPTNTGLAGTAPLADTHSSSTDRGTAAEQGASAARNLRDSAQERAQQAREALGNAGHRARDMKQNVERTLADRLEQGANRLRSRAGGEAGADAASGSAAYASASGGTMAAEHGQNRQAEKLAEGMDATAKWLREGDLKETIQEQTRANPGRTLLVALGVGYLLGKALRRR